MKQIFIASLLALTWVGYAGDGNVVIGNGFVMNGDKNLAIGNNGEVSGNDNVQIGDSSSITGHGNFQIGNNQQAIGNNQYQNNIMPPSNQNNPNQGIYPPNVYPMGTPVSSLGPPIAPLNGFGVSIYHIVNPQTVNGGEYILLQRPEFLNNLPSNNLRIQASTNN